MGAAIRTILLSDWDPLLVRDVSVAQDGLGAARGLAYIAHVVDMKVYQFAEGLQARYTGLCRRLATIDLPFGISCPTSCVVSAQEGFADVASFATDLTRQEPDGSFV